MRRPWNGCRPKRRRDRQHAPRDIVEGHQRNRIWYGRLLGVHPPPAKVLAILNVLLDEAREVLTDVALTQEQIRAKLLHNPATSEWGNSISSIRRAIRLAERLGYLSVADQPVEGRGIHINRYRLHVPDEAAASWDLIQRNAENARRKGSERAQAERKAAARDNRHQEATRPPVPPVVHPPDEPARNPEVWLAGLDEARRAARSGKPSRAP